MIFIRQYWRQIVFITALAAVIYKVYSFGYDNADTEWQSKWDKNQLEIANSNVEYSKKIEQLETELQTEIDKVNKNAKIEVIRLQTDLNAANITASILRDKAAKYAAAARQCSTDTATSSLRGSADTPADMLAELLSRADQAAGELAEYADRLVIARDACEAAYSKIKHPHNGG